MNYSIVHTLSEDQTRELHTLFQGEWWTRGRTLKEVGRMLEHTPFVFGVCDSTTGQLLAFARVISDRVFKALLLDVIVHPDHRQRGMGRFLLAQVLDHPEIKRVRHIELYCLPERFELYRHFGFSEELGAIRHMRKINGSQPPPSALDQGEPR